MIFFFKKALKDISENRVLNGVAVTTMALTVLIVSAFALFFVNAEDLIREGKQGLRIMVYLAPHAPVQDIEKKLRTLPGVAAVTFIGKAEALAAFRKQLAGQASLLDGLKENPLPDAFDIRLSPDQSQDGIEPLAKKFKTLSGVSEVEYGRQWMDRISSVLNLFRFVGYTMGGLFLLAAVFIVANTIRLVLYSRREEVEIMRLVGATNGFIQAPFYMEGILQGAAGALLGLFLLYAGFLWVGAHVTQGVLGSGFSLHFFSPETCGIILLASMLIGWIGCYLSLRQFLK